jgi:ribosomal protein S18 acetylase RimI-like enzyme
MSLTSGRIRQAKIGDLDRLYEICVRTADAGDDATRLHHDPLLPGHVWAAPYLHHAPEHAFVVVDDHDVAGGYVLGALDSRAFEAELERSWWPALRARYPLDQPGRTEADQATVERIHRPSTAMDQIVGTHPSHLHIDLLPHVQGAGHGRRLIEVLLGSLAEAGSPGVHLGVSNRNERAIGFYRALGFTELGRSRHGVAFGRRLA